MASNDSQFYRFYVPLFRRGKDPENYFSYRSIAVRAFRGLEDVSINFSRNELVLLLRLNESGKTSILKSIECFDFCNDPDAEDLNSFFTSIRNKQDIDCSTPSVITAQIDFDKPLSWRFFKKSFESARLSKDLRPIVDQFVKNSNETMSLKVSRIFPFNNGNPGPSYYRFEEIDPLSNEKLESVLAQEIVRRCPYIIYFEDFQDAIPERIYTRPQNPGYRKDWYEIIDGLFYNTKPSYTIRSFMSYFSKSNRRDDDARTVLKQVNKTLQDTFTKKWEDLSGVKEIEMAELAFQEAGNYFEIKITERDGTTYSVHERSKGAIWYLAFLMKTEFRRKKLREGSGKPIYLIDEPGSNLHSTAQTNMIGDFFRLVEDTTVIYTTHSRYLVSPSIVKNTYIVGRSGGVVTCQRWGEYIKNKDANVSYYQPLHDCLNIVPNNFEIPWERAIITEGPSDYFALEVMQEVLQQERSHVIYPSSGASNLSTLISLNLGWLAKFKILLDSDDEGIKQKERYIDEFSLPLSTFVMLPKSHSKIENMFEKQELIDLYKLATGETTETVKKKQFLSMMQTLSWMSRSRRGEIDHIISEKTKRRFAELLGSLKSGLD